MAAFYLVDEAQLDLLDRQAKRLYTEDRMDGDEMRNMAQVIQSVTVVARALKVNDG